MKLVFRPGGRYGLCPEKKVNIKLEKNKLTGKKLKKIRISLQSNSNPNTNQFQFDLKE